MHWPTIGYIKWWERLLGWRDIRCDTCGTIGGATRWSGGRILSCRFCRAKGYFLVDDHGTPLGKYGTRDEADAALASLIEVDPAAGNECGVVTL